MADLSAAATAQSARGRSSTIAWAKRATGPEQREAPSADRQGARGDGKTRSGRRPPVVPACPQRGRGPASIAREKLVDSLQNADHFWPVQRLGCRVVIAVAEVDETPQR